MSGEIIIPTDLDAIAEHNRIRELMIDRELYCSPQVVQLLKEETST